MGHQAAESAGNDTAPCRRKYVRERLRHWLGRFALLAAIVYFGIYAVENRDLFPELRWDPESGLVLASAIIIYAANYALIALA